MYRIPPSPNYLVRNPYSYCFRMKVPKDIQPIIVLKELRYSLKTGNLSDAKNKARYMAGQVQQLFRDIQNGYLEDMNLPKEQIRKMVKKFLKERIDHYNKPVISEDYADEWDTAPFNSPEGLEEAIDFIEEIKADLNFKLQKGSYGTLMQRSLRKRNQGPPGRADSNLILSLISSTKVRRW